jgi:hypothetical protein
MTGPSIAPAVAVAPPLRGKTAWKELGFRVPTTAIPRATEQYLVPNYSSVYRTRYLYAQDQVVPIDPPAAARRAEAAQRAVTTRRQHMEQAMRNVSLTITRGWTPGQVLSLAISTHGGNYQGDLGPFRWSNRAARNAIRHNLTNYERLWSRINRGYTGEAAYEILRSRVDALVAEAYPEYSEGTPEVPYPTRAHR